MKMYLGSDEIKKLIEKEELVKDFINLETQLQPNGFDLTLLKIEKFKNSGFISFSDKKLADVEEVPIDENNYWMLDKGAYLITFNEVVKLPKGIMAITIQRSTIMRNGAMTIVGSWDSGYNGRGTNLLIVTNPHGIILQRNARIVQMHFIKIEGKNFLYEGHYQKENINKEKKKFKPDEDAERFVGEKKQ